MKQFIKIGMLSVFCLLSLGGGAWAQTAIYAEINQVEGSGAAFPKTNNAECHQTMARDANGTIVPMTYHHIVPRNLLVDFFNTLRTQNQLVFIRGGLIKIIENTLARLSSSSLPATCYDAFLEVDGNEVRDIDTYTFVLDKVIAGEELDFYEREVMDIIVIMYQWWPANIHHGPSRRLNPNNNGHNPNIDDGGDGFEESAKWVVNSSVFQQLEFLNQHMINYTNNQNTCDAKQVNQLLIKLAPRRSYGVYDASKWFIQTGSGPTVGFWRLRTN